MTADEKRTAFSALHQRDTPFVLANAWDVGSARVLAGLGADAIGTSSSGWAFTLGRPDGTGDLASAIEHAVALDRATPLPVSADLEDGYGSSPEAAAAAVTASIDAGLAGCCIEDIALGRGEAYDFDHAVARVAACVAAARSGETPGAPFSFVARADGALTGAYDLDEAIRRLQAFEAAGADVLFAPVVGDLDALRRVCAAVSRPVNVLAIGPYASCTLEELGEAGASRVSVGSMFARITHGALIDAAARVLSGGAVDPDEQAASGSEVNALLEKGSA